MFVTLQKWAAICVGVLIAFGLVWWLGYSYAAKSIEPQVKIVTKTVTKTVIKRPDGTTEETSVETQPIAVIANPQKRAYNYSLEVTQSVVAAVDGRWKALEVTVGRRMVGDFWLVGGYRHEPREVSVGVRYEW